MKRHLIAAAVIVGALLISAPAHAAETSPALARTACPNLTDWPDRDDEVYPEITTGGLKFGDKTNIHRAVTPLDLADVRAGSFEATGPADGALLMKLETDTPYATIVVTSDGKFWSSKIPADQAGGQDLPVAAAVDLVGLPALPGKTLTASTHVVSAGVGVGNGPGAGRVVSSLTFHGHTYDLTCKAATTSSASPTATASHTSKPPVKTTGASPSPSRSTVAGALAITGPPTGLYVAGGVGLLLVGAVLLLARSRRTRFTA